MAAGASFVTELARRYDLDLARVVAVGHSAGGQLALWVASETGLARGVVALAGVADLRYGAEQRIGRGAVQDFLGGEPDDVPDRYAAASPIERLPLGVPQVLVHGTQDDAVPFEIAQRYRDAGVAVGDDVRLVGLPGRGHFELIDPLTDAWQAVPSAVESVL